MKCPKCPRKMIKRRNYAPSLGFYPGYTWSHEYSLSEVLVNPELCKHTIQSSEKTEAET